MKSQNMLIIHQGSLGDLVALFPAILTLQNRFAPIDLLCPESLGRMTCKLGIARQHFSQEAGYISSLYSGQPDARAIKLLRCYDRILLFSFSDQLKKAINQITDGACIRIPPRPDPAARLHISTHILSLLQQKGLTGNANLDAKPVVEQSKKASSPPIDGHTAPILIHPGSGSRRKNWPISNFKVLESYLQKAGKTVEWILGPAEEELFEGLQDTDGKRRLHLGRDLVGLVDLIRSARGFIGNDSGVGHLAAFLGLDTVVIFGPSEPLRWAPFGPAVRVVRPELECLPCFETEQTNCPDPECLLQTSPQRVFEAFRELSECE